MFSKFAMTSTDALKIKLQYLQLQKQYIEMVESNHQEKFSQFLKDKRLHPLEEDFRNKGNQLPQQETKQPQIFKTIYKKLVLVHHPDHGGNNENFVLIRQAYENSDFETLFDFYSNCFGGSGDLDLCNEFVLSARIEFLVQFVQQKKSYHWWLWNEGTEQEKQMVESNYCTELQYQQETNKLLTKKLQRLKLENFLLRERLETEKLLTNNLEFCLNRKFNVGSDEINN